MMDYRITGLSPAPFRHLCGQSDKALKARNVIRMPVDTWPGFPDRIEMREGATDRFDAIKPKPAVMHTRMPALRAFDSNHMIIAAGKAQGQNQEALIQNLLATPNASYIQAHNASHGCYSGLIRPAWPQALNRAQRGHR